MNSTLKRKSELLINLMINDNPLSKIRVDKQEKGLLANEFFLVSLDNKFTRV